MILWDYPSELYIGLWWKPSYPFLGYSNMMNKLVNVWTNSSGLVWLSMYGERGSGAFTTIGNLQIDGGATLKYQNMSGTQIVLGQWHQLEIYYKVNTSGANGIFRWWLDGELLGSYTNCNYGTNQYFQQTEITQSWDGPDPYVPEGWNQDAWHRFDHVRVSDPTGGSPVSSGYFSVWSVI